MKTKCPNCNKTVDLKNQNRPFCSDRCKLIDFGDWIDGNYRITENQYTDILSDDETQKTRH